MCVCLLVSRVEKLLEVLVNVLVNVVRWGIQGEVGSGLVCRWNVALTERNICRIQSLGTIEERICARRPGLKVANLFSPQLNPMFLCRSISA